MSYSVKSSYISGFFSFERDRSLVYKQFLTSVRWNTLEALAYQCLLVASQALLFYAMPRQEYGLVGILFSVTYLIVMTTNLGLDLSLGPLFHCWSRSKNTVRQFLIPQLLVQPCLILFMALGVAGTQHITGNVPLLQKLFPSLIAVIFLLIICESVKKTTRILLHLLFFNRITALVEIATIILYIASLSIMYLCDIRLTPFHIFLPLLILSCAGTVILTFSLYQWYATLPNNNNHMIPQTRIVQNRLWNYGVQLVHAFFSGNFLVSLFGIQFGLAHAGAAKFANSIAHGIAMIVRKIFDTSSGSYFSHIKNQASSEKKTIFAQVSMHINELLYSIMLAALLIVPKFLKTYKTFDIQMGYLILLLGAIHMFELFYIAYERFFINEEKSYYLLLAYGIPTMLLSIMYYHSAALSMHTLLLGLLFARIITFISLTFFSIFLWNLRPTVNARPRYILYSLGASLVILFFIS